MTFRPVSLCVALGLAVFAAGAGAQRGPGAQTTAELRSSIARLESQRLQLRSEATRKDAERRDLEQQLERVRRDQQQIEQQLSSIDLQVRQLEQALIQPR